MQAHLSCIDLIMSACMQAVGLAEKRDCRADALSGGMKRKLQVALALLGNSRVVLLGVPSSSCLYLYTPVHA